ncbi:MAG: hypothetical protein H7062_11345 [Candidatus Saccharimonas sp.]|nr:hypothetical protein [Planctomycetaceae bacterium]
MSMTSFWCGCSLFVAMLGAENPAVDGPPLKVASPSTATSRQKHYIVQIKLIEVDEQGRETVLGSPQVKTTGGNAGLSIDHADGRHFDFTINLRKGGGPNAAPRDLTPGALPGDTGDESVERRLDQKITLQAVQLSRKDVLRDVAQQAGINIAIDPESAKSVKVQLETPIDFKADGESVIEVLDRIVQPLKLGYAVKHEVVLIAVAEKLHPDPEEYSVKTYEVADLVGPKAGTGETKSDFGPLIQRIKTTIQSETWDRKGGSATIRPFNSTSSLVVRQTSAGHIAVERLLDKMRQERPKVIGE